MSDSDVEDLNAVAPTPEAEKMSARTLTPEAEKMKPFNEAIMGAIEGGDTKNNHILVAEIKKGMDAATSMEEVKCVVLALPTSNGSHGQSHTMNRVMKALQAEGLLPVPDEGAITWAKTLKSATKQAVVWNAFAGLFSMDKSEARAKVLECIPPVAVPARKNSEVSPLCTRPAPAHDSRRVDHRSHVPGAFSSLPAVPRLLTPPLPLASQTTRAASVVADRLALAAELLACPQWQQKYKELIQVSAVKSSDRPALLTAGAPDIAAANWELGEAHAGLKRDGSLSAQHPVLRLPRA